jgi:hypothetical protein
MVDAAAGPPRARCDDDDADHPGRQPFAGLPAPAASSALDLVPKGYAARAGVNPDQFHAALHFQLGPGSKPQFRPVLELGVGNGVRLVSLSGDVLGHASSSTTQLYRRR